jgi:hypothetical protein
MKEKKRRTLMNSSTTRKSACLVMLSIVAVLLLAISTIAPASAAGVKVHRALDGPTIAGTWTSEHGDVTFEGPDDKHLTGSWNKGYGIIDEGEYGPDTGWLSVKYHGNFEGGLSGKAFLHLDDNNTLTGTFQNDGGKGGNWTMHRKPKPQPPQQ